MKEKLSELLDSLVEYLPKLDRGLDSIVTDIQIGNNEGALSTLKQFTEGLSWVYEALLAVRNTKVITLEVFDLDKNLRVLDELNNALEHRDFVLISDILQYEIKEELRQYLIESVKIKTEIL